MKNKLIFTIALSCLLTACAVSNETPPNMLGPSTPESIENEEYEVVTEGTPPDGFANYASVIEEYRRFAGYAIEFDDEYYAQVDDLDLWINRGWMGGLIAEAKVGRDVIKEDFSYAIQDLNGSGSPELILAMGDSVVQAIFSTVENKPRLLADFNAKNYCEIDTTGMLYIQSTSGASYTTFASYRISQNGDELVWIDEFGAYGHDMDTLETLYFKTVGGVKQNITINEFEELCNQFSDVSHSTRNSKIKFISLFDG